MSLRSLSPRKSNKGKAFSSDRKWDIISVMERCKIELIYDKIEYKDDDLDEHDNYEEINEDLL